MRKKESDIESLRLANKSLLQENANIQQSFQHFRAEKDRQIQSHENYQKDVLAAMHKAQDNLEI